MFEVHQDRHPHIQAKLKHRQHMQMKKFARDRYKVLPQTCLNTKGCYEQQNQGCLDSRCPLMFRVEESPQVHKPPHCGNLPHLKW